MGVQTFAKEIYSFINDCNFNDENTDIKKSIVKIVIDVG